MKTTLFLSLLTLPFIGFSQGGNTCASAAGSPIAIPFTGTGTNCAPATNDYNLVGASCMDALNTQGADWLYYFCATTTGTINVALTNMTLYCINPAQPYQFPALSVWQGCPNVGTCVSGTSSQGTPETATSANVTAGQCYYILIDCYPGYCPCFDYSIAVKYIATPPTQPSCTNMGFDAGSFAGWSGTYGYTIHDGAPGAPTPMYNPVTFAIAAPQHTITAGAGVDPFGGFPIVAPGLGPNSARLGDGTTAGYGGATLEQKFNVTAANALLTYQYAVVIQDANSIAAAHTPEQQPFFKIEVFDCVGNPIVCGQYLVVGGPGIPGFTLAPGTTDVYYRPWTPVAVDLTPYIGTCARIKFSVGDCSLGAHFAYAYIDVQCAPMAITGPNFVCPGIPTTLAAPAGAAAYSWAPGGQTTQTIIVTPAVSTTYTCTITSVAGPMCTTFLTYSVTVYPPASVSSTSQTVCAGASATITATPTVSGGGFSWTPSGAITPSITVSPAITTTYICTYTDLNGCADTSHSTVTVTPLPIVTVNSPSICPGDTAHLVASGATTYAWTAGATSTGVNTADATPAITTTYTVTGTLGACSNTAVSTVTSGGSIIVNVNSPTICAGQTANLTAGGGTTYTWSAGTTSTGTNTANANPAATTTYTVTGTSGSCTGTAVSTVTVNPLPITTVNSPTICAGVTANLTAGGATSYTWSAGATSTGTNTANANPAVTTTYTVTGTSLTCTSTAVSTVTVNPLPITTVNSPTVCAGVTANLTAGGATSYTWSTGATSTGTNTANANPAITTTYTVTGTSLTCTSTAASTVTVNPLPITFVNSPTICVGQTANLTAGGATTYTWSAGATSTGTNTANANPAVTTTYTVTGTSLTCTSTAVSTVSVNPLPITTVNSPTVCAGVTANLTAGGATSYTWSAGATATGVTTATASPIVTTTYTVTGTSLTCTSTAVSTVTINPAPVSNAGPDILLCTGILGNLGAPTTSGDTYLWSPTSGLSSTTVSNPTVTLTNPGPSALTSNYTVTTTNTASGCSSTDAVIVTVDPVQTANAGSPQSLCFGSSVLLAGSIGGSATGGTWSGGTGTFSPNATTLNASYTPSAADTVGGSVTLTLTSSGAGACPFASSNVTLSFFPSPIVAFSSTPPGCPPLCVKFTDLSTVVGGTIIGWSWNFGDGSPADLTQNPSHCYNNSGFYDVTLSVTSNNGCSSTLMISQFIQVFDVPTASFIPTPPSSTIFDGSITFTDQSYSNISTWAWNFGDGSTSITQNNVHQFPITNPGIYNVTLTVTNTDGCVSSTTLPIEIGPEFTFYIPNCVTPNGDGVNDYFFGDGIGIVTYDIWIFDRWGNEIFHGDYLYDKWDGRANGGADVAQQDVYVWKVRLTDVFSRKHAYIGTVTIVK